MNDKDYQFGILRVLLFLLIKLEINLLSTTPPSQARYSMMSEKFCLKWNDFESNVSKSFGLLRNEEYLHDVTLVCDDNSQVSAHKLVLSACSEYFKTIFKNNKHPSPLICLEGISSPELRDILDYMYNGEANIFQEKLDNFLTVAQRFQILGLIQNKDLKQEQEANDEEVFQENNIIQDVSPMINDDHLISGSKITRKRNPENVNNECLP